MATGGGCQPDGNSDSVKSSARPNNTLFINTRLMSYELRQWERAVRPREPEHSPVRTKLTARWASCTRLAPHACAHPGCLRAQGTKPLRVNGAQRLSAGPPSP